MNVWLINHFAIPPTSAGGTRHYSLARKLRNLGVNVTIVASSRNYLSREQIRPSDGRAHCFEDVDGVTFVWIHTPEYGTGLVGRLWNMICFAVKVARGMWARCLPEPDVIVGSSPSLFAALGAALLASRRNTPFIMEVRDIWPQTLLDVGNFSPRNPAIRIMAWIERYLYDTALRIVTLLPLSVHHIESISPGADVKTVWIPNGVDVALTGDSSHPSAGAVFTLVYAGAHGVANGLDTVLDAAKHLTLEVDSGAVRFCLIGDGPAKRRLQERVENEGIGGVVFHPPIPKEQIHCVLREADGFLMVLRDSPVFKWGISPNKLFDYLLAGRPIVFAVNTPFNPVRDSNAGFSVPSGDASKLADAIRELLETPKEERLAMGARGRAYVEHNHDIAKLAERWFTVFREVVDDV